jgi:hypothetical protein
MISLDEDYIGASNSEIVVHGLKVCGGVLARLASNRLLGAHFTNATPSASILVGCTYMMNHWAAGSAVQDLYFIANLNAWAIRTDKYNNTHTLLDDLKAMFNYRGQIWVYDKDIKGASVDVKIGAVAGIAYRVTPNPDPMLAHPKNDVKRVSIPTRTQSGGRNVPLAGNSTALVQDLDAMYIHQVQTNQAGWNLFVQGDMIPV